MKKLPLTSKFEPLPVRHEPAMQAEQLLIEILYNEPISSFRWDDSFFLKMRVASFQFQNPHVVKAFSAFLEKVMSSNLLPFYKDDRRHTPFRHPIQAMAICFTSYFESFGTAHH